MDKKTIEELRDEFVEWYAYGLDKWKIIEWFNYQIENANKKRFQ